MTYSFEFRQPYDAETIAIFSDAQYKASSSVGIPLIVTSQPAWPEDESKEERRLKDAGYPVERRMATDAEILQVLPGVQVILPDRLYTVSTKANRLATMATNIPDPNSGEEHPEISMTVTGGSSYTLQPGPTFKVAIPTSFQAPTDWNVRRLRLEILVQEHDRMPCEAVIVSMEPASKVESRQETIGELGIDAAKAAGYIVGAADVGVTAKFDKTFTIKHVDRRIETAGLFTKACSWRVSDDLMVYDFNATFDIHHSGQTALTISALLRVDIERKIMHLFSRLYVKSAVPKAYIYKPGDSVLLAKEYHQTDPLSADDQIFRDIIDRYKDKPGNYEPLICELAHAGDKNHMERYADLKQEQGDLDAALTWYRKAADVQNLKAMVKLGKVLLRRHDEIAAKHWFERAGASGNPTGWRELGMLLEPSDRASASEYYRRAVQAGDKFSMLGLRRTHKLWWLHPSFWRLP